MTVSAQVLIFMASQNLRRQKQPADLRGRSMSSVVLFALLWEKATSQQKQRYVYIASHVFIL